MKINLENIRRLVDFFKANPERLDMYYFSRYPRGCGCLAGYAAFGNDLGKAGLEELCLHRALDPVTVWPQEILADFLEMDSIEDAECLFSVDSWPDAARKRYVDAHDAGDSAGRVEALEMMYDYVASRADGQS